MQPTVDDYRELIAAEGSALLDQLDHISPDDWSRPSPCVGWDLLDVLVHLQLGTMVHTRMVENALAGLGEPAWGLPEGVDARAHFQQVHQEAHDQGPAANLAQLRERLPAYDAALAQAADADLEKPAWFYGLPGAVLRTPIAAFTNDLIVHASDFRRPLGLEPAFSSAGARYAGQATLAYLPLFTQAGLLGGATGSVRQTIDGLTSTVTLGPDGIQVSPDAASGPPAAARVGELMTDGGTWTLLVWRQIPPADAERDGLLQIAGDRALVEAYLGALKTP